MDGPLATDISPMNGSFQQELSSYACADDLEGSSDDDDNLSQSDDDAHISSIGKYSMPNQQKLFVGGLSDLTTEGK